MRKLIPVRRYMTAVPETIEKDLRLGEAKDRMFALGIRHLPVLDDGELVGILSHRDIAVAESVAAAYDVGGITVGLVMTPEPFTCGPNAHVEAVAREMAEYRYGSTIVVDRTRPTRVIGVFTTTDAMRALAAIIDEQPGESSPPDFA